MTYKTATELGITEEERDGLIRIAAYFRGGAVVHVPEDEPLYFVEEAVVALGRTGFNMDITVIGASGATEEKYECGSVACVGGHLSLILQGVEGFLSGSTSFRLTPEQMEKADDYVRTSQIRSPMATLFSPSFLEIFYGQWHLLSPAVAADAIQSFLETGAPRWDLAARKHGLDSIVVEEAE